MMFQISSVRDPEASPIAGLRVFLFGKLMTKKRRRKMARRRVCCTLSKVTVRRSGGSGLVALVAGMAIALTAAAGQENSVDSDPLLELGFRETVGAAPGYVDDQACRLCHEEIWDSYQSMGMARAFYRPSRERSSEDFAENHYYHAPSERHYEMEWRGEELRFRRYQLDAEGERINQIERRVLRPCMFCHNAYPEVPEGSDAASQPHLYPERLPEGLGCQRCHGPGAEHVRRAADGELDPEVLSATIVNPGKLSAELRDSVCFGCHLLPAVAVTGERRLERGDYSFRPGEPLADYQVVLDIDEGGRSRSDRFEINHHPYRLRQSRCWSASEGALSCLTCHDPHRKIPVAERAAHYRAACLSCHQEEKHPSLASVGDNGTPTELSDCVECHMPRRRTEDVIHVAMTDHRIQRRPPPGDLLAPLSEKEPVITDIVVYDNIGPGGPKGDLYRALGAVHTIPTADAVAWLEHSIEASGTRSETAWVELAKAQAKRGQSEKVLATTAQILERWPRQAMAFELRGTARARLGDLAAGIVDLRRARELNPQRPESLFNLGLLLAAAGENEEAVEVFRRAVAIQPNLYKGWYHLGRVSLLLDRHDEGEAAFRQALAVEPAYDMAYVGLGRLLADRGDVAAARRWLEHGTRTASRPQAVREALAALNGTAPAGAEE